MSAHDDDILDFDFFDDEAPEWIAGAGRRSRGAHRTTVGLGRPRFRPPAERRRRCCGSSVWSRSRS